MGREILIYMKNILLNIILFGWLQIVTAQAITAKFECLSYDSYIREYCSSCALQQSNFYGVKITYNKVNTYLWHPIKIKTNGNWADLEDSFGTKFRIRTGDIFTYNTPKLLYQFLGGCKPTSLPPVEVKSTYANYRWEDDPEVDFLFQTGATPAKVIFQTAFNTDSTTIAIDSLQDFRILESGNYNISFTTNFIPSATGQVYVQIRKNNGILWQSVLQCLSVVSGFLDYASSRSVPLVDGDIITMTYYRPSGTVTYTVYQSHLKILKIN